jgi:hypothetical protein
MVGGFFGGTQSLNQQRIEIIPMGRWVENAFFEQAWTNNI